VHKNAVRNKVVRNKVARVPHAPVLRVGVFLLRVPHPRKKVAHDKIFSAASPTIAFQQRFRMVKILPAPSARATQSASLASLVRASQPSASRVESHALQFQLLDKRGGGRPVLDDPGDPRRFEAPQLLTS
jgi:hypothetical protein